ncbi:hypothetical protein A2962_00020 [Candidatus Woesebacteria bacterium RIFCSPLOWO2_01_FULL_39_61]|uniref:DNA polymerase III delta N-terminal domain-containing protein n=1 Tax=Candidatus Woesebacteria bacterium RIFCSPHIGHO2_02_FULL_39_13 TaxID=1802505 RepID=A0A1F7Z268_9BACT|nr:MAG: hypothetical protein A2692_02435 [Candidatus Woesebacteria bacterium RIFCSPHIGHO2_01_FULL_39_95]OGM33672.1 MAG: hypothetical protein A3D01_06000 [Candidatus Woesebacteria bacterium RIFCSPHIGHO2_02_FULL_39_13]OGM38908.1 MAG: hypothetical protein A3E13_02150 [Candidatus Woesebacteria bacterium RIFCSPHIGHO2_12_FULL_40_20]OGM68120.1 MAG: hypothetical protein A2962_00020 [Candidatus Woesebacteria bacterium RIFCSPLOWO2_01_FULL_39_61]
MKIIILHGDDVIGSYDRLAKFIEIAKLRNWETYKIGDGNLTLTEALSSGSLFQKEKLIILENVSLINKITSDWINKEADNLDATLVIYNQGIVDLKLIKSLPKNTKVEEFKLKSYIWNFLDSFYPGNVKNVLLLLNEVVKKDPVEFLFTLLVRHLRDLYWLKIDPKALNYPSWRLSKLKRQASRFSEKVLKSIIADLADADIKSKTSQVDLKDSLDFLIATKLE